MNLTFFADGLFPYKVGGIQKHTVNLVQQLDRLGVRVSLFYLRQPSHPPAVEIISKVFPETQYLKLHPVQPAWSPYFPGHYYFTCWWQSRFFLREMLKTEEEFDFVFAQGYTGWEAMRQRRRGKAKIPPVGMHGHGLEALQEGRGIGFNLKTTFAPVWQRQNVRLADANLSLGGRIDDVLVEAGADRETILPAHNGIDSKWLITEHQIKPSKDKTRFLFVGRDSIRKGFGELDDAVRKLMSHEKFEMDFVGPIPENRRIVADNVRYHGKVTSEEVLRRIYRGCEVLLVPSYSEGMPTVILEAMASGMHIIATDVGAVHLLVNQRNGELIAPRDVRGLREAMVRTMEKDLMRSRQASRERVEQYVWEKAALRFIHKLEKFLSEFSKRTGAETYT